MRKVITTVVFLMISNFIQAQNLVPNPSFEDTVTCPIGIGNIYDAVGWSSYYQTPDYLNSCNTGQAGAPSNLFGYQQPRTGNAYAGFYTYSTTGLGREIVGISLIHDLTINRKYFVSFYVSRAVNPSLAVRINIANNKIGARFSTTPFSFSNPVPIDNFAHIYSEQIITDSTSWIEIYGSFVADSAYRYVSFGNFFEDSLVMHISFDSIAARAYYYIDDISVIEDTSTSIITYGKSVNAVRIYPNPVRDWIVLEGTGINSVEITDAFGSNLGFYPLMSSSLRHEFYFGALSPDVYFLKINMIDGLYTVKK